jgi:hypothetical protein
VPVGVAVILADPIQQFSSPSRRHVFGHCLEKEMVFHENVVPPWQKHGATMAKMCGDTMVAAATVAASAAVDRRCPIIVGCHLPPQLSIAVFVLLQLRVFRYLFSQKE